MVKTARPPDAPPLIVAHRGGAPGDIENSASAFQQALEIGADLIECDLRRSADGVIVLYHDERIDGKKVNAMTVRELRSRHPALLTLDDLLMLLAGQTGSVRIVLDLKERGLEQALIPVLEQRPDIVRSVLVSTVHMLSLRRLAKRFPGMRLALSRGHLLSSMPVAALRDIVAVLFRPVYPLWMLAHMRWCNAGTIALQHRLLDSSSISRYHGLGYRVYAWTVDDLDTAEKLAAAGADYIASNEPWELMGRFGRHEGMK